MDFSSFLECHDRVIHLDRAGEASRARLAALAVARGRTAVLVASDRESFARLKSLATLYSPDASLSDEPVERPVWKSPVLGMPQGVLLRTDRAVWSSRLAGLYALSRGGAKLVVASSESLLLRYPPRDFFDHASLEVSCGADIPQDILLDELADWGYARVPMVTHPGEMARRGDILDVFAPGYIRPLRLEFFGDNVEEIRLFDAESQRSPPAS